MSQSQWQTITEHFQDLIQRGDLAVGARLPSDAKLAESWGVSRPTAHRALAELQRRGLVTRSKGSGTVVVEHGPTVKGRVALVLDRMDPLHNFPHSNLLRGIQDTLGEEVSLVIAQCENDSKREARQLERLRTEVDGILIYPTSDPRNNGLMERIRASGTPIVALDRYPEGLHTDLVVTDNFGATEQAMKSLIAKGHERIAFLSFHKPDFSSVQERYAAYTHTMVGRCPGLPNAYTRWFPTVLELEPYLLVQSIQDALVALTRNNQPATALFCVEDVIAAGVLEAAEALGLSIPEDLEIAFYNDWPPMTYRAPRGLNRIVQSVYGIGQAAAELLKSRIEGDTSEPRLVKVAADFYPAEDAARTPSRIPASFPVSSPTNGG